MKIRYLIPVFVLVAACSPRDPQNSAFCGMTMMASGNRVLERLGNIHAIIAQPPEELLTGQIPTRALGYGVAHSVPTVTDSNRVQLDYQGEGFPEAPGYGLALVDDSSEVFRGVLVFDLEPPRGYPEIGAVTNQNLSVPLFALRIHWTSVNSEQCPLFPADSTEP